MKLREFWQSKYSEIEELCKKHKLSYVKLQTCTKSYSKKFMIFGVTEPANNRRGLYDDTPGKAVLLVKITNGELELVQTEYSNYVML